MLEIEKSMVLMSQIVDLGIGQEFSEIITNIAMCSNPTT